MREGEEGGRMREGGREGGKREGERGREKVGRRGRCPILRL